MTAAKKTITGLYSGSKLPGTSATYGFDGTDGYSDGYYSALDNVLSY
jgi:hypothetical protein